MPWSPCGAAIIGVLNIVIGNRRAPIIGGVIPGYLQLVRTWRHGESRWRRWKAGGAIQCCHRPGPVTLAIAGFHLDMVDHTIL